MAFCYRQVRHGLTCQVVSETPTSPSPCVSSPRSLSTNNHYSFLIMHGWIVCGDIFANAVCLGTAWPTWHYCIIALARGMIRSLFHHFGPLPYISSCCARPLYFPMVVLSYLSMICASVPVNPFKCRDNFAAVLHESATKVAFS